MLKIADKKFSALVAPFGLAIALVLGGAGSVSAADSMHGPYLSDSSGKTVFNGAGECWKTVGGIDLPVVECGDAAPMMPMKGEMDSDGDGVADSRDECPDTMKGVMVNAYGCPKDSDGDGVPDSMDKCPGTPKGAAVDISGCQMAGAVSVDETVDHFDFDRATLKSAMMGVLDKVADMLNTSPADEKVEIIGHTDSTGPEAYNQQLSERRAQSAAKYLSEQGIASDRISVSGRGESEPVASNATRAGRAQNRRVEIRSR
jgi:OOP family OmpA-OmpF porin